MNTVSGLRRTSVTFEFPVRFRIHSSLLTRKQDVVVEFQSVQRRCVCIPIDSSVGFIHFQIKVDSSNGYFVFDW